MAKRRQNALRKHHLLIIRHPGGFTWQIRFGRNARPVMEGGVLHQSQAEAVAEGERALAQLEADPLTLSQGSD